MKHNENIVKRRINKATGDVSVSIPADIRHKSPSTFYNVELVENGCLLYSPINVSSAVVPTKDHTAEHLIDHIHKGGVANE